MTTLYLTEARRSDDRRTLELAWTDGHRATLEADYLRGFCPCAMCQGHDGGEIEYHPPRRPVILVGIDPVGNYAINLAFSDQHATGIYRFDFLRQICNCPSCRTPH